MIEGKLQLSEWEREGERVFKHFVRVSDWQFLLSKLKPVNSEAPAAA